MSEMPKIHNETLADSIAMLEQILEVMPQDKDAITALYKAHYNSGNIERAFEHLNTLVNVVSGGGDSEILEFVKSELTKFKSDYPSEVIAIIARLRTLEESPASSVALPIKPANETSRSSAATETDISEELALAWRLYEENQLSQEEYSSVLHDLTEISSKEIDVPISVLHVLNDRGFTQMNRIINYLSSRAGVPYLSLSNFEMGEEVKSTLPLEYSAKLGALPFSFFGQDLLVGVLNPFNNMLVDKVERELGKRVHTYLVEPDDYDAALSKIREAMKAA